MYVRTALQHSGILNELWNRTGEGNCVSKRSASRIRSRRQHYRVSHERVRLSASSAGKGLASGENSRIAWINNKRRFRNGSGVCYGYPYVVLVMHPAAQPALIRKMIRRSMAAAEPELIFNGGLNEGFGCSNRIRY